MHIKILLLRPFAYEDIPNNCLKSQVLQEERNLVAHIFKMFSIQQIFQLDCEQMSLR